MSAPLLEVRDLQKFYGALQALAKVSLRVQPGEIHGVIGPNGSGKSTLMRIIAGEYPPSHGSIWFKGQDITGWSPVERARAGLAIKFQITSIFPDLTVRDNLLLALQSRQRLWSLVRSRSRGRLADDTARWLVDLGLAERADDPAGVLSHGEQQWLEIGLALATRPSLLLLDEPTAGLSPEERQFAGRLIRRSTGDCAVILVEHDIDFVKGLSDVITVLHQGQVLDEGPPSAIEQSEAVRTIYVTGGRGDHA